MTSRTLLAFALGVIPAAMANAWLLTDPVQGGTQMSDAWVRAEYFSILKMIWPLDVLTIDVCVAGIWMGFQTEVARAIAGSTTQ